MKITVAIDSFKGSLNSIEAGNAAAEGIKRVYPDSVINVRPIADGGEGTTDAIATGLGGSLRTVKAHDALMREIDCTYAVANRTAIIEMAAAAGLPQLKESERNPLNTTTYGVGEMIADALSIGCRDFVIGIGGSATNDGGVGMLSALGFRFTDKNGDPISHGAGGLAALANIDENGLLDGLSESRFRVACDVTNPLCGSNGCSAVYGPQKGASPEAVQMMDGWLDAFAKLTKEKHKAADKSFPGAGAAGGMGFALREYLHGELVSGIKLILDITNLEQYIKDSDIVITGEGRLDSQSAMGKAPAGVAALAKKHGKPCIAFAGAVSEDAGICNTVGIDAFFPIRRRICTLEEALDKQNARCDLADTAEQVARLIKSFCQI